MGMFSFVKSIGKKLGFGRSEEEARIQALEDEAAKAAAEEALNQQTATALEFAVNDLGIGISDFSVQLMSGVATLTGTAATQADKEMAILTVGNYEGIEAVDDGITVDSPEPEAYFYTVQSGDSLSKIAKSCYGIIHAYDVIFGANQPMIKDADEIFPGQILRVPAIEGVPYVVEGGDTLGGIAKKFYGEAGQYTAIFQANTDVLASPDAVEVGQQLHIPVLHALPS